MAGSRHPILLGMDVGTGVGGTEVILGLELVVGETDGLLHLGDACLLCKAK